MQICDPGQRSSDLAYCHKGYWYQIWSLQHIIVQVSYGSKDQMYCCAPMLLTDGVCLNNIYSNIKHQYYNSYYNVINSGFSNKIKSYLKLSTDRVLLPATGISPIQDYHIYSLFKIQDPSVTNWDFNLRPKDTHSTSKTTTAYCTWAFGIMDYLHACLQTIFAKQGKIALSVPHSQN